MANKRKFERFSRNTPRRDEGPIVSIGKVGTFGINKAAMSALGNPAAVTLHYDREARVVGLMAADLTDPDAYQIRRAHQDRSDSSVVAGKAFLVHWRIPVGTLRRYPATLSEPGLLEIDLSKELQSSSS
ncbi:MAG TPA: hypothetical protein VLA19_16000 [Herpetosiphonaceae bacterium]|nr:hypothetical protein [Herpetosiphonaceae bacterium]